MGVREMPRDLFFILWWTIAARMKHFPFDLPNKYRYVIHFSIGTWQMITDTFCRYFNLSGWHGSKPDIEMLRYISSRKRTYSTTTTYTFIVHVRLLFVILIVFLFILFPFLFLSLFFLAHVLHFFCLVVPCSKAVITIYLDTRIRPLIC